jgi:NADPH:quinone reductase-like Zn-dependent oxidoreductase
VYVKFRPKITAFEKGAPEQLMSQELVCLAPKTCLGVPELLEYSGKPHTNSLGRATAMGGMGRDFDGGYAEFTCVPASQAQVIKSELSWELLGALPEMMQTAWGSLIKSLQLKKEDSLLIRGGTTSVGLAAAALAKTICAHVAVTTRKPEREAMLLANGANEVFIDDGSIAEEVRKRHPEGFSKILELIG